MTNKPTFRTVALVIFFTAYCGLQARVVISREKQNEVIKTARMLLSVPSADTSFNTGTIKDPFHLPVKEAPVAQVVEEVKKVEEVRELTPSEILTLVAQKLKPTGFIDQGGQQYLILNGRKVQDGVVFNFPHEQKRYAIEITKIKTNSFTLNLNSESKTVSME